MIVVTAVNEAESYLKPDTCTKVVLTIIAACLLIQVVQSVMFGQLRVNAQESND
jgi:hypothetical protein